MHEAFGYRHINDAGKVCYIDGSRTWWDSAKAPELVIGALVLIEKLLFGNLAGARSDTAIAQDFDGYWRSSQSIYVSDIAHNKTVFHQVNDEVAHRKWLVPKDKDTWLSIDTEESPNTPWLVTHLKSPPSTLTIKNWPPTTASEFVFWLDQNDPNYVNQIIFGLRKSIFSKGKEKQGRYGKDIGLALTWPEGGEENKLGCGLSLSVPKTAAQAIAEGRLKQAKIVLRKSTEKITRCSLVRADAHYIQNRNNPNHNSSLKNKKVVLVGAGTIGGSLAKLLCTHGAGWGSKGEVHIVDPDTFSVENIGRHLLGAESLGIDKALAVKAILKTSFPHLNIKQHTKSITKCWSLITDNSIIVDATGSQTVSIAITDYVSTNNINATLIHSWVHGHGAATVSLLNDRKNRKGACFRCLWRIEDGTYKPNYELSRDPDKDAPVFAGCHQSYHPYSSTISTLAAAQSMNLVCDHLNSNAAKTLKFNILNKELCQNRNDATPEKSADCPLCNR